MIANLLWTTLRVSRRDNAKEYEAEFGPFPDLLLQQQARPRRATG